VGKRKESLPPGGWNRSLELIIMTRIKKYLLVSLTAVWLAQPSVSSASNKSKIICTQDISGTDIFTEKIYLHTDREIYVAGENLFFKLYLYDEERKNLSRKSKIAYIMICDSGNKKITQLCLLLSGGIGYGSLSLPDTLNTGSYQVIAYTNWMRNFGESGFFRKQILVANRFDDELSSSSPAVRNRKGITKMQENEPILSVSTDRKSYHQREKVTLNLSLLMKRKANLSISVFEETPEEYNNTTLVETISSSDRGTATAVLENPANRKICNYLLEDKGYILSGRVQNPISPAGILVKLSTPDSVANLTYSTTDASGKYFFQLDELYYDKDLYISFYDPQKEAESAIIPDEKFVSDRDYNLSNTIISDQTRQFIKKSQTIANINKAYKIQTVINEKKPVTMRPRGNVYGEPDFKVLLTDFVPLRNLEEIVRETLPYARLRKNASNYEIEILDHDNKIFMKNSAVFLNGMLVNNINSLINFGSDKIRKIETTCHSRVSGSIEFNGIMSVFTSPDVKNDIFFNKQSLHLPPVFLLNHSLYNIPEYSSYEKKESRNPDFRQLLYWKPSVDIFRDQPLTLDFFSSDTKGNYIIKIEGISSDGCPVSWEGYFDVR
jgi:hypothetical protein